MVVLLLEGGFRLLLVDDVIDAPGVVLAVEPREDLPGYVPEALQVDPGVVGLFLLLLLLLLLELPRVA